MFKIMAALIFLLIPVAWGYVSKTSTDIWDLDISEEIHQLEDSEEQESFDNFDEDNVPSDWKSEFEAEHDIEEIDENPNIIDDAYPELMLPLDDEGHFDMVNPTSIGDYELFEGDMMLGDFLTPTDDLAILHDQQNDADGSSSLYRKMSIKKLFRWPEEDGVPTFYYKIHKSARRIRRIINAAIEEWSSHTCIRFHELGLSTNRTVLLQEKNKYYVLFVGLRGCWSVLGYQGWNRRITRQPLSLGNGCKRVRVAIHEIGHALGLLHEQSRSDRDDYVKIVFSNIRKRNIHNFRKARSIVNVPYDFSSVMHYGMSYFSKNGNPTLVPLDPHMFQFLVTRSSELTFRDVKVVNTAYKCIDKWANTSIDVHCENGGYVDANGVCVCPPGTNGTLCEHINGSYYPAPICGGNVTTPTTIQSPMFPKPFPKNSVCTWWFVAPRCYRVQLVIISFELLRRYRGICRWDFLELRTEDPINPGVRYCENDLETGATFLSSDRHLLVNFRGMYTFKSGFEADVTFISEPKCLETDIENNLINI